MLQQLKDHIVIDMGVEWHQPGPEIEDTPCDCGEESQAQVCYAEYASGKSHWHGRVHVRGGGLEPLCEHHAALEKRYWQTARSR